MKFAPEVLLKAAKGANKRQRKLDRKYTFVLLYRQVKFWANQKGTAMFKKTKTILNKLPNYLAQLVVIGAYLYTVNTLIDTNAIVESVVMFTSTVWLVEKLNRKQ